MKIAVLGGYNETQSVGAVCRAFRRAGHDVVHVRTLPEFTPDLWSIRDVDILFSFKIALDKVPPGLIRDLEIPVKIFWSFDDPHWVKYWAKNINVAKEHDIVLTSCKASEETYKAKGCPDVFFLPPAMDLEYYKDWREVELPKVQLCSFICTTLYPLKHFPRNLLDRSIMIDRLEKAFGEDFNLYGFNPPIQAKPSWRRSLSWESTLPAAIQGTKLNINNHVCSSDNLYFNERFFQIVATRRAMFVDRVAGFTSTLGGDNDRSFIYYSSLDELIEKLVYYKDKDADLASIGNAGFTKMRGWTYDEFVKEVMVAAKCGTPVPSFMR